MQFEVSNQQQIRVYHIIIYSTAKFHVGCSISERDKTLRSCVIIVFCVSKKLIAATMIAFRGPKSCSKRRLKTFYNVLLSQLNVYVSFFEIERLVVEVCHGLSPWSGGSFFITALLLFFLFGIFRSLYSLQYFSYQNLILQSVRNMLNWYVVTVCPNVFSTFTTVLLKLEITSTHLRVLVLLEVY